MARFSSDFFFLTLNPPFPSMVVKSTAIGFLSHVVKIKTKIYKKKSHGYCRTVPWLLEEGQQLPWLWWPAHLIVITQTMFSICDAAHLNWTENLEHAGLAQKNGFASAHFDILLRLLKGTTKWAEGTSSWPFCTLNGLLFFIWHQMGFIAVHFF